MFFFFNDTATPEIYTLSLHDALPIWDKDRDRFRSVLRDGIRATLLEGLPASLGLVLVAEPAVRLLFQHGHVTDRKSTRLNSSHANISYAVFCLTKKTHTHLLIANNIQ